MKETIYKAEDQAIFLVKIADDDSMEPRMFDGDELYITHQDSYKNGDFVLFSADGKNVFVRQFFMEQGTLMLRALNPRYEIMVFEGENIQDVTIFGRVTRLARLIDPSYQQHFEAAYDSQNLFVIEGVKA